MDLFELIPFGELAARLLARIVTPVDDHAGHDDEQREDDEARDRDRTGQGEDVGQHVPPHCASL